MRNKAPLAIIEQVLMLLVFALATVLCLKAFVWADTRSLESAQRDKAIVQAQSAAETLKSCGDYALSAELFGGTWDENNWIVQYDSDWNQTTSDGAFILKVSPQESKLKYLSTASVEVFKDDTNLASLHVSWQEVAYE